MNLKENIENILNNKEYYNKDEYINHLETFLKIVIDENSEVKEEMELLIKCQQQLENFRKTNQQIHNELKINDNKFEAFFSSSPEAILLADPKTGLIIDANHQAEKLFELPKSKLCGMHQLDLHPSEQRQKAIDAFNFNPQLLKKEAPPVDIEIITGSGKIKIAEIKGRIIQTNKQEFIIGNFRDITDRIKSINELSERNKIFDLIMEHSSDGIIVFDKNQNIQFASDSYYKQLGYSKKSELPANPDEIYNSLHPEDRDIVFNRIYSAIQKSEKSIIYTYRTRNKNNEYIWREDKANFVYKNGQYEGAYVISRDISERKNAEKIALESQERYRLLSSLTLEGIVIHNNGIAEIVNNSFCKLLGYKPEEIINQNIIDLLIHPDDKNIVLEKLQKQISEPYRIRGIRKDGSIIQAELEARDFEYKGDIRRVVAVRDISLNLQYENEIIQKNETLKTLNISLNEMLQFRDSNEVYDYTTNILSKKYNNSIILLNIIDSVNKTTEFKSVAGIENKIFNKIINKSGFNPFDKKYELLPYHESLFNQAKLIEFDGGLPEFADNQFPKQLSKMIQNMLGIHKIYTIGIKSRNKLIAVIHFFTFNKSEIKDKSFIEIFVNEVGLILDKIISNNKLKENQSKLDEAQKIAKIGSYETDFTTGKWKGSKEFCELFGFEAGKEYTIQEFADIVHPDDQDNVMKYFNDCLINQKDFNYEYRAINKKTNQVILVNSTSRIYYDENGNPLKIFGAKQDVTHIRNIESNLKNTLNDLKMAQEIAQIGNWQFDPEVGIPVWSNQVYEIYERNPDTSPPTLDEYKSIYSEKEFQKFHNAVTEAINNGKPYEIKLNLITKSGKNKWLKALCKPQEKTKSGKYYLRGTIQDITNIELYENQLKDNQQKLKELLATKDKILSIISHDLINPFNSIIGFSELILNQLKDDDYDNLENSMQILYNTSKKTFSLLNNLLQWSKIESGSIKFIRKEFNINNSVNEVLNLLQASALEKNISIVTNISDNLVINADRFMIETILRNLLYNAIKFTFKNGKIKIDISKNDENVLFSIEDNGIGISRENIKKLFKIEENYTTSGTNHETGTGLGLIICKEFIEMHNGKIWVESSLNVGTKITFTIK